MWWLRILVLGLCSGFALAVEPGQPAREHAVGVQLRVGLLQGEAREVSSDASFGFALHSQWFYRPNLGLRLGATFDRFGGWRDTHKQLSNFGFEFLPLVATFPWGRLLLWGGIGGGLAVGWFRSNDQEVAQPGLCELDPELPAGQCPAKESEVMPLLRAVFGIDCEVAPKVSMGLGIEYNQLFSDTVVVVTSNDTIREVSVFGNFFAFALAANYYF